MARIQQRRPRMALSAFRGDTGPGAAAVTFGALAQIGKELQEFIRPAAEQEAAAAGADSVTRAPDGTLGVSLVGPLAGPFGRIHDAAAGEEYLSRRSVDDSLELRKAAQNFEGDPEGFQQHADGYVRDVLGNTPRTLQPALGGMLRQEVGRLTLGLQSRALDLQITRTGNARDAQINMIAGDMIQGIATGLPQSEIEAQEVLLDQLYTAKINAPGSTFTAEQRDLELRDIRAKGEKARQVAVGGQIADAIKVLDQGLMPPNLEGLRASAQGHPSLAALETAVAAQQAVPGFTRMSPAEMQGAIDTLRGQEQTPEGAAVIGRLEGILKETTKAIEKDPIGTAEARGFTPGKVTLTDPASMAARAEAVEVLSARGENAAVPRFFSDVEREQFKAQILGAPPDAKVQIAGAIVAGAGPYAATALRELGAGNVFTHAGQLMASGMSPVVAAEIMAGDAIPAKDVTKLDEDVRRAARIEVLGEFEFSPSLAGAMPQVLEAANALYKTRALASPDSEPVKIYEGALRTVMGEANGAGGIQVVNNAKTLLPPGMRADVVEKTLEDVWGSFSLPVATASGLVDGEAAFRGRVQQQITAGETRFKATMSAPGVSISGGYPVLAGPDLTPAEGVDPNLPRDRAFILIPSGPNAYNLAYQSGAGMVLMRDSNDVTQPYSFSLRGLVE